MAGKYNISSASAKLRSVVPVRAVSPEYPTLLWEFYCTRGSHLSRLIEDMRISDAA